MLDLRTGRTTGPAGERITMRLGATPQKRRGPAMAGRPRPRLYRRRAGVAANLGRLLPHRLRAREALRLRLRNLEQWEVSDLRDDRRRRRRLRRNRPRRRAVRERQRPPRMAGSASRPPAPVDRRSPDPAVADLEGEGDHRRPARPGPLHAAGPDRVHANRQADRGRERGCRGYQKQTAASQAVSC